VAAELAVFLSFLKFYHYFENRFLGRIIRISNIFENIILSEDTEQLQPLNYIRRAAKSRDTERFQINASASCQVIFLKSQDV
jgi:hypothetical protein